MPDYKNSKIYKIVCNIERGNYSMVLCEECPCDNKEQSNVSGLKTIIVLIKLYQPERCTNITKTIKKKVYYIKNSTEKQTKKK